MRSITKTFEVETDGFEGSIEGYSIESGKNNWENFIRNQIGDEEKIIEALRENTDTILVIKNINIALKYQGKGHGSKVLNEALENPTDAVILFADNRETQKNGFELLEFYKKLGFKVIHEHESAPLLLYPEELAEKILTQSEPSVPAPG